MNNELNSATQAAMQGWKLVPIEPTPKMVDATFNDNLGALSHNKLNRHIYRAMLAAAPPSPQPVAESVPVLTFDEWFKREYPMDHNGRRPNYQDRYVRDLMRDAWNARNNPAAALQPVAREDEGGGVDAAISAIQFALEDDCGDGLQFLKYWNEGEFDIIRRNWADVPEAVFIGADPLHPLAPPPAIEPVARLTDAARLDLIETVVREKSYMCIHDNKPMTPVGLSVRGCGLRAALDGLAARRAGATGESKC